MLNTGSTVLFCIFRLTINKRCVPGTPEDLLDVIQQDPDDSDTYTKRCATDNCNVNIDDITDMARE